MLRLDFPRHPHLSWSHSEPASITQAVVFLTLCIFGVGLGAFVLNALIGLAFDLLSSGSR